MIRLQVLTTWDTDNLGDYEPGVLQDLRAAGFGVASYRDATDDAPAPVLDPNVMIAEIVITPAAYDWLYDDPGYGIGAILWSESL